MVCCNAWEILTELVKARTRHVSRSIKLVDKHPFEPEQTQTESCHETALNWLFHDSAASRVSALMNVSPIPEAVAGEDVQYVLAGREGQFGGRAPDCVEDPSVAVWTSELGGD